MSRTAFLDLQSLGERRFRTKGTITKEAWSTLKTARDTLAKVMEEDPSLGSDLHDTGAFKSATASYKSINEIKDNPLYKSFEHAKKLRVEIMDRAIDRLLHVLNYIDEENLKNVIKEFHGKLPEG